MKVKSVPGGYTPFNHDYLCQMLRSASADELLKVVEDVRKERERRDDKKNEYLNNIRKAISDAIHAGYAVDFYSNSDYSENPYFSVHSNNELLYDIELSIDE